MDDLKIEHLTALIDASAGGACMNCGRALCGHDVVLSTMLGHQDKILCSRCLAFAFARERDEFLEQALGHVAHRECLSEAFDYAADREGIERGPRPSCLFGPDRPSATPAPLPSLEPVALAAPVAPDAVFDAGDMGCGDLVLELRLRLRELAPRAVLRVLASDPGAPEDLPAWCRMTGNRLLAARHPEYLIQKKEP